MAFSSDFYTNNRHQLARQVGGGVFVFAAYSKMQRGSDYAARFEQESNFWWLTGIEAPDWQLIIDGTRNKSWLVMPQTSDINHVFGGSLSSEEAIRISGVSDVILYNDGIAMLRELAKKHTIAYMLGSHPYLEYFDFTLNPADKKLRDTLTRLFATVRDCRKELSALRAMKQPEEIQAMRQAINLTVEGFKLVKEKLPSLKYEYEVEAEFDYLFRRKGAAQAYEPIIAAGEHACTLHYYANRGMLKKRELVMMDVGARHYGYVADISRTYALGQPTKRQIAIHAGVQAAHKAIIALIGPDVEVRTYHERVDEIMITTLLELGLMSDSTDTTLYRTYFPHAISHGLGLDAHDSLGAPAYFKPGMVLTVEPGIYIPAEGIGVRIEDDILITATGHDNLSGKLSTDL